MSAMPVREARSGVRCTVEEIEKRLPESGVRSVAAFEHGSLLAKLYVPRGHDPQRPHTRHEVYVVVPGSGTFAAGEKRHPFGPGDFPFVPANVVHRFEAFGDDLRLRVLFYGPEGGEAA